MPRQDSILFHEIKLEISWGFRVFDFGPYNEIKNSENSEIFWRLLNFSEFHSYEEIGDFRFYPNYFIYLTGNCSGIWNG